MKVSASAGIEPAEEQVHYTIDAVSALNSRNGHRRRALIPVPLGQNSLFAPTLESHRTLVVFVHGFRGRALSSWESFPDFVDDFDGLRNADLLFYGYAPAPQRVQNIAINLRSHIDAIWRDSGSLGPEAAEALAGRPRPPEAGRHEVWDCLLLVAHSLGAVVVRRALLDCYLDASGRYDDAHWSRHASIFLFAPAHSGADILRLIDETFLTLRLPIAPALKHLYPCLLDIEKGCTALTALRDDYGSLPEAQRSLVSALSVILAENDRVVDPARFPGDPIHDQIDGKGHVDVCKPTRPFLVPVSKLSDVWSRSARVSAFGLAAVPVLPPLLEDNHI